MNIENIEATRTLEEILAVFPQSRDFFNSYNLGDLATDRPIALALQETDESKLAEFGFSRMEVMDQFSLFLKTLLNEDRTLRRVSSITILGGMNKRGGRENLELTLTAGQIVSLVGPTGSGKSRLLNDIECIAQRDTPTRRQVLVEGRALSDEERFDLSGKMVAQLSQNMNFVMDLSVREFLEMHALSRLRSNLEEVVRQCFDCANELAGEKFELDTRVTQLSGGQSRSLMIADTAYISASPVVLIDEIENAGIDRRQALNRLAAKDKIVIISTHDPLLALSSDLRLVMKNGAVERCIRAGAQERESFYRIEAMDKALQAVRQRIRNGEIIGSEGRV